MKYKILPGTATFAALVGLQEKLIATNEQIEALQHEVGATAIMVDAHTLGGGVNGFKMSHKPDGWKVAWKHGLEPVYFPRSIPKNKLLLDWIAAIPKILPDELNTIVGFKKQWKGIRRYICPVVTFGPDFHLMRVSEDADYSPNADMVELTVSEYKRLVTTLQAEPDSIE